MMEICLRRNHESRGALDEGHGVAVLVEILGNVMSRITAADDDGPLVLSLGGNGSSEF